MVLFKKNIDLKAFMYNNFGQETTNHQFQVQKKNVNAYKYIFGCPTA